MGSCSQIWTILTVVGVTDAPYANVRLDQVAGIRLTRRISCYEFEYQSKPLFLFDPVFQFLVLRGTVK